MKPEPTSPPRSRRSSSGFSPTSSSYSSFADTAIAASAHARGPGARSDDAAFDVCHPGLALRAVLFVQGVLATGVLLVSPGWSEAWSALGLAVFSGLSGTLAWLVGVCALRRLLARLPVLPRGVVVLALGGVCALVAYLMVQPLLGRGVPGPRWPGVMLTGWLLAGTLWGWLTLRVRSRLPAEAAARLVELQARIRPHFLFNALNTAIALVRVDPARAEEVLEGLAQLFRTALEDQGEAVTLADEVELAQRYLAIEQIRFGERMRVRWELDPAANGAKVPPLLLQPLVENAVRHGVEPSPSGADIVVRTRVRHGQALVDITNTLGGQASQPGHGIALQNVRERLQLLHDVAARFEVRRDRERYRVKIELPL